MTPLKLNEQEIAALRSVMRKQTGPAAFARRARCVLLCATGVRRVDIRMTLGCDDGFISDVLQSHHFVSGEDLAQTLYRYALLYNQQLPQSTLGSKTPLDAMKQWYKSHPHLFVKRPCNLAGGDRQGSRK